ncbi:hypothetical protein ACIQ6K_33925 [Streptomyces sp. NPDC096354]|uniref:hypothetical protein n=1 Tax=Streptomyces sp. NPDC096354 TaxID=3366088 RepID=UPI00380EB7E4
MAHPAVRIDADTLLSTIPAEVADAFEDFLDEYAVEMNMGRTSTVRVITAVFHRYCRRVLHIEPPSGTEVIRMLDVFGYLPEWTETKGKQRLLVVRGIQLTDAANNGEFTK